VHVYIAVVMAVTPRIPRWQHIDGLLKGLIQVVQATWTLRANDTVLNYVATLINATVVYTCRLINS
jgi:hypothetical protein